MVGRVLEDTKIFRGSSINLRKSRENTSVGCMPQCGIFANLGIIGEFLVYPLRKLQDFIC